MKKTGIYIIGLFFLLIACVHQNKNKEIRNDEYPVWIKMMEQPEVEMKSIREEFDRYWENHEHFKGDRSKQFEQWYTINSRRLDQYGKVISAKQVSSEFQKLRLKSGVEQQGDWFNYGPVSVGPRNGKKRDGGRVKDIEFHPTDKNTFYVSTFNGGLFKTTDYGTSWEPLTDNLTEFVFVSEVSATDPNVILIGTNLGVYKSVDGGQNWNTTLVMVITKALIVQDENPNIIIAGTEVGIYRSEDGGETWNFIMNAEKVEDLDVHPTNPDILYASTNGTPSEFFRSIDGGKTWVKNTAFGQGCFMGVAVTPAQPDYVYVLNLRDHLGDNSFEGFYFSDNSGVTFTKQSGQSPCISGYSADGVISRGQPNYNLFVCADPVNPNLVYAGGVRSWKSTDKGKTWTHFYENITTDGDNLHLDQLNWAYSPHDNHIFAVNDGGVYYLNEEDKFQMITDGLPISEIYECTQSQTVKTNVAGGTMHCGIKLNNNGEWFTPWGGDEATCIIDPTDENYIYHLKYEKISRSSDRGFTFKNIYPANTEKGNYTGTGALHKRDANTLFVGLFELHRTKNARASTVNWEIISSFGGSTKIQKVEQCSSNHDILYVARGSSFYRCDNANDVSPTSFVNLSSNLPVGGVNDIATHPSNSNLVYILSGSKIYKSEDKGLNWNDITSNLPAVALLEMIYDNLSDEGIYVGTDIGVFYKDTTMTDWVDYSKNLAAVRVSGMDIYYGKDRDDSFITISTDGRGFWRSLLYGSTVVKPNADFTANKTNVFVSEELTLTNKSSDNPVGSFVWKIEGGTPAISFELNPTLTFSEPGTYKVTLEISNSAGLASKSMDIVVETLPNPVANISANKTVVFEGGIVGFTDESENLPASWEWTFEGGEPSTSNEQNPMVTYHAIGNFNVTLKVTNNSGSDLKTWNEYISVVENSGSGDLQAHYEFDNNLADGSSYKRDLVIFGSFTPVFTKDKNGDAEKAYVTPENNELYLTNSYKGISGDGERTMTAWFKTNSEGPLRKTIVSWGRNVEGQMFNVMVHHDGRIRVEAGSCNVQSTIENLNDNYWHHVAVTYNPGDGPKLKDIKIYIDGVQDTNRPDGTGESYRSQDVSIQTDNTENYVRIGSVKYANYYWVGALDDVRIYSTSLNANEISEIYGLKTASNETQHPKYVEFFSGKSMVKINVHSVQKSDLRLYDLKGSLIICKELQGGMNEIPVKQGIYIAQVKTRNTTESQKLLSY